LRLLLLRQREPLVQCSLDIRVRGVGGDFRIVEGLPPDSGKGLPPIRGRYMRLSLAGTEEALDRLHVALAPADAAAADVDPAAAVEARSDLAQLAAEVAS